MYFFQRLETLNQYPDFNNYLVYIFIKVTVEAESTRAIAGLILKNNVKLYYNNFPEEIRSFIHQHSMAAIDDPSPLIRATAGTLISTIAMRGGLTNWPDLLPTLCQYIDSSQYFTCEGAFSALHKICEDCSDQFSSEELSQSLGVLIPKFIQFFSHSSPTIKSHAIACVNQFVISHPPALVANILPFIKVCLVCNLSVTMGLLVIFTM